MILRTRDLDRQITLLRPVSTQESVYGARETTWEVLDTVWAQVRDMLPSRGEQLADGLSLARRPARIRIRYRDDVTSGMRVQYGDRNLRIVSQPAELGRREGLELMAEELSTEGQEP